jgi:nicotinamide-nucleotide amidase
MKARIISTGTELTIGQTVDTNAAWLAQQLAGLGVECSGHAAVPDDQALIHDAITAASREAEIVLISGGLGPTPDDLTRFALADAMGVGMWSDEASLDQIKAFFEQRKREMSEANRVQALFPEGAKPIENTCGTAPGMHARVGDAEVFVMPGVPFEMKQMFDRDVRPALSARTGGGVILQHTLRTFGMPEGEIGEKLADLMKRGRNPTVGTGAADLIISIRLNARGASAEEARGLVEADAAEVRRRMGSFVFGEGDETMADAVAKLLASRRKTVSTAESCTGGLIAKQLTDISGSSAYFVQGVVSYANEAKCRLLGISPGLIASRGAVSPEVAQAMAVSCRHMAGTDFALSATGVAGPTGGTADKPVGLVYVGLADDQGVAVKELRLGDSLSREAIRDRTAKIALNLLRLRLTEHA